MRETYETWAGSQVGKIPGGEHDNHSSILAWRNPYAEEPGVLQSVGSDSVG